MRDRSSGIEPETSSVSYRIDLPVEIQVFLPEETFTPMPLHGTTECISVNGVKLGVPMVNPGFFRQLVRGARHAKLALVNPFTGEQLRLGGRIDWFDFHDNREGTESCYFGVSLFKKEDEPYHTYLRMLDVLVAGGPAAHRR